LQELSQERVRLYSDKGKKKASALQIWVASQVGDPVTALSKGEVFGELQLRAGIERILRRRWQHTSEAAKSLGLACATVSSTVTGNGAISLRLLPSLCSAVDIKLIDLLRGHRVPLGNNCVPIVFIPYFKSEKRQWDEEKLRRAVSRIMKREPDIRLGQLADRIGVQPSVFYRKLPDVVEQLRESRQARRGATVGGLICVSLGNCALRNVS
jgi:DNA-binding Xre family transcriptional regulator